MDHDQIVIPVSLDRSYMFGYYVTKHRNIGGGGR